jgi:hypothetical protein
MTPYEITLLLHCHVMAEPSHGWPCAATPLLDETLVSFYNNGLVTADYKTTERAAVYIDALCATPWPVQQWIMPAGQRT